MTTETRGSEKLFSGENGLCSLTAEELSQVGGGYPNYNFANMYEIPDFFPLGTPQEIFSKNLLEDKLDVPRGISNGFIRKF